MNKELGPTAVILIYGLINLCLDLIYGNGSVSFLFERSVRNPKRPKLCDEKEKN